MSRRNFAAALLAIVMALFAAPGASVAADPAASPQVLSAQSLRKFQREAAGIRADMAPGKRYAGLDESAMQDVERALNEIQYLLESAGSMDAMNMAQQTKLANLVDRVNTTLAESVGPVAAASPDEELICERIRVAGSNRYQRICMTAEEREWRQKEAQDRFNRR